MNDKHPTALDRPTPTLNEENMVRTGAAVSSDDFDLSQKPPPDGLADLFRFHGEIRAAMSMLESIVDAREPTRRERRVARYLVAFLKGPLVWHDIDEECSLLPMLRRRVFAEENELEVALAKISKDHDILEEMVEPVVELLELMGKGRRAPLELADKAGGLSRHLLKHIADEEHYLFPFARMVLTNQDMKELDGEIRVRQAARETNAAAVLPID